jgi:hypothetical protein
MNLIISAQVTYEIYDVKSFDEAVSIFQTAVTNHEMDGVTPVLVHDAFATEINKDGEVIQPLKIYEQENK